MPGMLLVPAGLGGVAARLEVILEEMLDVSGLPTGRIPSMSCLGCNKGCSWLLCSSEWDFIFACWHLKLFKYSAPT